MESLRYDQGDADDTRSGVAEGLRSEAHVTVLVGELTERELDLQRRLVRESLLLRPA
jgi:hypothetical protein